MKELEDRAPAMAYRRCGGVSRFRGRTLSLAHVPEDLRHLHGSDDKEDPEAENPE